MPLKIYGVVSLKLDLEMSFCSVDDVIGLIEQLLLHCWPKPIIAPFERITYSAALRLYGTDQPDISFKCLVSSGFFNIILVSKQIF